MSIYLVINFYNINDEMYLVDLPGYGYAKVSKSEKDKWGVIMERYLQDRQELCAIFLLVDIRHEPTENDRLMYDYIINKAGNHPCLIIANKADKLAPTKVATRVQELQNSLNPLKDITFLPFSSEKKNYTENVWNKIEKYIN